jgi:3-oxoadipate enol-lactonase
MTLHFTDSGGSGEAVLLVHAIGCDHRMWDALGEALSPRFRVIRMDVRGHGKSAVTAGPYSLDQLADDARDVLDALGVQKAHWVGLSMGGMIGQAFALRHGERLRKLVVANTTSSYGPEGPKMWEARAKAVHEGGMAAITELAMQRYFSDDFRASHSDIVDRIGDGFLATDPAGYIACCNAIRELDFSGDLHRIKAPTLVIAGEKDVGTPAAMSEAIAKAIPGAKLAVIRGAAHLSAVEDPAAFNRLVEDFLGG